MPILEGQMSGGGTAAIPLSADGTSVVTSAGAVPSGGATAAKQDTGNTSLGTLVTKQVDGSQKTQQVDSSGNVAPAGDTVARASFVKVTNGTQTMPTGDAAARPVFVEVSDGSAAVALATSTKQSDGSQKTQIVDSAGTHTMPAGDAATRPVFVEITDGTTAVAVATAANQTSELAALELLKLPTTFTAITPSDATNVTTTCTKGILVTVAGIVNVTGVGGSAVGLGTLPVGTHIPAALSRVNVATTATVVGLSGP